MNAVEQSENVARRDIHRFSIPTVGIDINDENILQLEGHSSRLSPMGRYTVEKAISTAPLSTVQHSQQ